MRMRTIYPNFKRWGRIRGSGLSQRWALRRGRAGGPAQKGMFTDISYLLDPNQHSAVVKGYIENPNGRLRGGQFVSVSIDRPAPPGVVEIPTTAILEDGKQSVVFVQPDPKKP